MKTFLPSPVPIRYLPNLTKTFYRSLSKILLSLGLLLPAGSLLAQSPADSVVTSINREVERLMAEHAIPGVLITIIKDHKVLWTKAYGVKDKRTKEPVTESTIFQVASMSKSVTAVGVMQLVQAGRLGLDANINNTLTAWKLKENRHNKGQSITLRQLLSHTAGINNGVARLGFPGIKPGRPIPTPVEVLEGRYEPFIVPLIPKVKSVYSPNEDFHYSNAGYNIVQQILIEATQQTFPVLMDSLIFSPLQMSRTTFDQRIEQSHLAPLLASGHRKPGQVLPHKRRLYPEMAAAGLFTTSEDLAKLLIELQLSYLGKSDRILSQSATKEMFTKVRMPTGKQWALGWNFYDGPDGQPNAWFHNGSDRGFRSYMMVQPEGGFGLIIMTNSNKGKELIGPIRSRIVKAYL